MIEIGGTLGSDVNLGQETGGGNLACLGTAVVSESGCMLLPCRGILRGSDMLVVPRHSVRSTVMIE